MKTVCFDFDATINSYKSDWLGVSILPDPPVAGIKEQIDIIREKYKVIIYSTRCSTQDGKEAVRKWLEKYNIEVDGLSYEKPIAFVYVDDRAICFEGNAEGLAEKVDNFKNWIEKVSDTKLNDVQIGLSENYSENVEKVGKKYKKLFKRLKES